MASAAFATISGENGPFQKVMSSGSRISISQPLHLLPKHFSSGEQRVHKLFGIKRQQIPSLFADAHIAHGQSQLSRNGHHDSAFGRAIELGQDYSRDSGR